jgi:hypothetical protein
VFRRGEGERALVTRSAKKSLRTNATLRRLATLRQRLQRELEVGARCTSGVKPRISRMTRITCLSPFLGGTSVSIVSVAMISPTRSLFLIALKAHSAPTSAATRALLARRVPNCVDCDRSTTSITVISRSS